MATETQVEVVMPQMGVSVSEGTITKWLKQEGEPIARDEALLEISTDKVDTEVPSPGEGVVAKILVQEGETVEVGTVLAVIAPEGAEVPRRRACRPPRRRPSPRPRPPPTRPRRPRPRRPSRRHRRRRRHRAGPLPRPRPADGNGRTFVSPVVARIASEHGVDPSAVQGTGAGGRVTKKDILAFVEGGGQAHAAPSAAKARPQPPRSRSRPRPLRLRRRSRAGSSGRARRSGRAEAGSAPVAEAGEPAAGETFEPMTAMRKGIAEHMRRSLDTSAHVTSAIEVDMSKVVAIREKLKKEYEAAYGVNPTYLSFIARATVETLREYPWINGEIRGDKIVTRNYVNLGFAVELADGKGLIVPVVKHSEGLNLLGMARGVAEIAERARNKKLMPDEVQGGTFTITNPGGYGTFHGTPVISQPQAGDPRHLRGRQAALGDPGRARPGRDRDPPDHEPDAHVRPPPRRRRARRPLPARPAQEARELGRKRLLASSRSSRPSRRPR